MCDARRDVVRRGYDEIGDRYLAARTAGGDMALLRELVARLRPGDAVLDAGCGAGVPVMRELADAGMGVVGVDVSGTQLGLARSHVPTVHLAQADLVTLPFGDRSFDALVSFYAVIHVSRAYHRAVFAEFRRVLHPGGLALLCLVRPRGGTLTWNGRLRVPSRTARRTLPTRPWCRHAPRVVMPPIRGVPDRGENGTG